MLEVPQAGLAWGGRKIRPYIRFEQVSPNELWQMDHRSPLQLGDGPCYPLTILDDCFRPLLNLEPVPTRLASPCRAG